MCLVCQINKCELYCILSENAYLNSDKTLRIEKYVYDLYPRNKKSSSKWFQNFNRMSLQVTYITAVPSFLISFAYTEVYLEKRSNFSFERHWPL